MQSALVICDTSTSTQAAAAHYLQVFTYSTVAGRGPAHSAHIPSGVAQLELAGQHHFVFQKKAAFCPHDGPTL